ncbi:MAG: hypothetical protein Q8941_13445 [Bacteroidota bacterium]|nr:hypothetical protein [Bacteroidota bacterium]
MIRILLYGLLIWFLYKLIFHFIIPVYNTTRHIKKKFREMHAHMQEEQQGFGRPSAETQSSQRSASEDYIDFEEIK